MQLRLSDQAREFIRRKGGTVTVEAPHLESEGCCKTTLVPARARPGQPRRAAEYDQVRAEDVTVFWPRGLQAEADGVFIDVVRRLFGGELVVEGVRLPEQIARYLQEVEELGPTMLRLKRGGEE
jgi:hypothetical protein